MKVGHTNQKRQIQIKLSRISMILQFYRLRQSDLAQLTDLSVGTVNKTIKCLESGDLREKWVRRNVRLISSALNLDPHILVGYALVGLVTPNRQNPTKFNLGW